MIALAIAALAILAGGAVFLKDRMTGATVKQAQAKLDANVAQATQTSAADAVSTIERDITHETTIERTVDHAQATVDSAPDAVAADAAGRAGLCQISADFCAASGVQRADPH